MPLDLQHSARSKARWKNKSAGLGYLLSRIRRELETRFALATDKTPPPTHAQSDQQALLLFDCDDSDFQIAASTRQQVSVFDLPTAKQLHHLSSGQWDNIVMCLQPAWLDFENIPIMIRHALNPGGRLLFCTFGPDTLVQLRWAWQQVDDLPHVHPFMDMHNLGDLLLKCGFTQPILDVDRITVNYTQFSMLVADLRAEGYINILPQRRKTLTGKSRTNDFYKNLARLQPPGQPLAITFELIYGLATAPPSPSPSAPIKVAPPKI